MSAKAKATNRLVLDHANKTAKAVNIALIAVTQVGMEWRIFSNMSFLGRLRWLVTGKIRPRKSVASVVPAPEVEGIGEQVA